MTTHTDIIENIAAAIRPDAYLELGLYQGDTFNRIAPHCGRAVGVDIKNVSINGEFFLGSTTEYFDTIVDSSRFNLIFIDADHSFESVKKDFNNAVKCLAHGGIIVLHDTDPENDKLFDSGYCGDSYKMVDYLEFNDLYNIVTLPIAEAGLSIITAKASTRTHQRKLK
jgi:predicted O-methyltransferase YrrM